jgi:hypothetical protein
MLIQYPHSILPPSAAIVLPSTTSSHVKNFEKVLSKEGVCKAYRNTAQAEVSAFRRQVFDEGGGTTCIPLKHKFNIIEDV